MSPRRGGVGRVELRCVALHRACAAPRLPASAFNAPASAALTAAASSAKYSLGGAAIAFSAIPRIIRASQLRFPTGLCCCGGGGSCSPCCRAAAGSGVPSPSSAPARRAATSRMASSAEAWWPGRSSRLARPAGAVEGGGRSREGTGRTT